MDTGQDEIAVCSDCRRNIERSVEVANPGLGPNQDSDRGCCCDFPDFSGKLWKPVLIGPDMFGKGDFSQTCLFALVDNLPYGPFAVGVVGMKMHFTVEPGRFKVYKTYKKNPSQFSF